MTHPARLLLNKGVRHRILDGHPWVFASEVERIEGAAQDGGTVGLISPKGQFIGSALYNSRSQIVARRYSREEVALDEALMGRRLDQALAHRADAGAGGASGASAGLVGVGPAAGADRGSLRGRAGDADADAGHGASARRSSRGCWRQRPAAGRSWRATTRRCGSWRDCRWSGRCCWGKSAAPVEVTIAGIRYPLDLWSGQKTGFYLDQAENYEAVAAYARGRRMLDCFTNQGAFALSAMRAGAASCRAIDQSAEALRLAAATATAAGLEVDWVQGNVFDLLRAAEQAHETFDLVVLDPPSFTKGKGNRASALRGYHELHLRALRLLTAGGIMATFSCSHHVTAADWEELLERAAKDTGSTLRLRRRLGQSSDHPILVNVPETEYLHGYVVEKISGV